MSNDDDWRRRRAEEIFGPGQTPWSTAAPRRAKGDETIFPIPRPGPPPATVPPAKAVVPPAQAAEPLVPPKLPPAAKPPIATEPVLPMKPPIAKPPTPTGPALAPMTPVAAKPAVASEAVSPLKPPIAAKTAVASEPASSSKPPVSAKPPIEPLAPSNPPVTVKPPVATEAVLPPPPPARIQSSAVEKPRWIKVEPSAPPLVTASIPPPLDLPVTPSTRPSAATPWRLLAVIVALCVVGALGWLVRSGLRPKAAKETVATTVSPMTAKPAVNVPLQTARSPVALAAVEPAPVAPVVTVPVEPPVATAENPGSISSDRSTKSPVVRTPAKSATGDHAKRVISTARLAMTQTEPFAPKPAKTRVKPPQPVELARAEPVRARTSSTPDHAPSIPVETDGRGLVARTAASPSVPPVVSPVRAAPVARAAAMPPVVAARTATAAAARTAALRPSFNCRRSRGDVIRAICRDGELAGLDREVATRFAVLDRTVDAATVQQIHHAQTTFLNDRQSCTDRDCLVELYRNRLRELDEFAH